jgi:hypothetical protein
MQPLKNKDTKQRAPPTTLVVQRDREPTCGTDQLICIVQTIGGGLGPGAILDIGYAWSSSGRVGKRIDKLPTQRLTP